MSLKNFPHAHTTDGVSRQDEQDVPVEGRKGSTSEYGNREKKVADLPQFHKRNERGSSRELDRAARDNRNLWKDPDPDLPANRAKAPVYGSGEDFVQEQGERPAEQWHSDAPGMTHYGSEGKVGFINEHEDKIIDKHAPATKLLRHKSGSKEAYALAPESKVASTKSKRN